VAVVFAADVPFINVLPVKVIVCAKFVVLRTVSIVPFCAEVGAAIVIAAAEVAVIATTPSAIVIAPDAL